MIDERNRKKFRIGHLDFKTHHSENFNNLELKMNAYISSLRTSIEFQKELISNLAKENRILRDALKILYIANR
jgi:hypothetical protein